LTIHLESKDTFILLRKNLNFSHFPKFEILGCDNLVVHYHPRKANMVSDALSRKARCKYLLAVCLTWEESSIQVPRDMAQYNVTLNPMQRGEIIAT
jgi:hypothetical protein